MISKDIPRDVPIIKVVRLASVNDWASINYLQAGEYEPAADMQKFSIHPRELLVLFHFAVRHPRSRKISWINTLV